NDAGSLEVRPQLGLFSKSDPQLLRRERRLWVVAAEQAIAISERYRYAFVDSLDGTPVVQQSDLLLLRDRAGDFALFGPANEPYSVETMAAFAATLPN